MVSALGVSRPNLRRTFSIVVAILALGIIWLALGGGKGQPAVNVAAASSQPTAQASVVAAGLNLPTLELGIGTSNEAASLTPVNSRSGFGDNQAALMWAAIGAITLTVLVLSLAWKNRPAVASATREVRPPPHVFRRFSSS